MIITMLAHGSQKKKKKKKYELTAMFSQIFVTVLYYFLQTN